MRNLLQIISFFERTACIVALAFMSVLIFIDVAMRTLFGTGLHWVGQTAVYANMVVALLGVGLASASAAHLRPRFADNWLPANWQPLLNSIAEAITACACVIFVYLSAQLVYETYQLQEISTVLRSLIWPVQLLLPLAFLLTALRHACYAIRPELRPAATTDVME
jgi:TRAP-type C4-dicarboxylate transport system permease small subunit